MSFLARVRDYLIAEPRAQRAMLDLRAAPVVWAPTQLNRPQYPTRTLATYDNGAYRKSALIFRCVQYVANAVGSAPLRLYRDVEGEAQRDDDSDLARLLASPNPGSGGARFLSFATVALLTAGFVVIEKERGKGGQVVNLWVLRPDWLRPIPRASGDVDWEYRSPNSITGRILIAEDVITVPYADVPTGGAYGIGPLEVLLREIGIANSLTDFLKTFLDRGALPLYVLIPSDDPKVSRQFTEPALREAFEASWRERYQGMGQNLSPLPLVGAKDVRPLGLNFDELAYPALNDLTDTRICTGFGIPPILVGAQAGLEQATYSNYGQARASFYEDTMTYLWSRLDDAFTRHLLPEFIAEPGYDLVFDTSDIPALQDDENDRVTRAVSLFTSGLASRHPAQRHAGIEPHGPDVFLEPFSAVAVPVDDAGQRGRAVPTATAMIGEPGIVTRDGRRYLDARALTDGQRAHRDRADETARAMIARLDKALQPEMRAYFAWQRDELVRAVTGDDDAERAMGASVWDRVADVFAASGERLAATFAGWWRRANDLVHRTIAGQLGVDLDDATVDAGYDRVRRALGSRIVGIDARTRSEVADIITRATADGAAPSEIADRLRGLFDETYANRYATVARTEATQAVAAASAAAYDSAGVTEVEVRDNPGHGEDYGASDGLTCATRDGLVVTTRQAMAHISADHPNGSARMIAVPAGESGEDV